MKKNLVFAFILGLNIFIIAQKKEIQTTTNYTYEEVMASNDTKKIAGFIKNNPSHPKVGELKIKLLKLISPDNSNINTPNTGRNYSEKNNSTVGKNNNSPGKNKRTADILNAILNPETNSSSAIVFIENKSNCPMVMKMTGRMSYSLNVPAKGKNFIDLPKGSYTFSANVCNSRYQAEKSIQSNITLSLNEQ